jgi:hypothetical protein
VQPEGDEKMHVRSGLVGMMFAFGMLRIEASVSFIGTGPQQALQPEIQLIEFSGIFLVMSKFLKISC